MNEKARVIKTYHLSRSGRRMAYLLLIGAVLVWIFALWTLKNTLQIGLRPQNLGPSLRNLGQRLTGAAGAQPLSAEEAIPSLVMLVLVLVVPLLVWNIIEELRAAIVLRTEGITFRSLGIELAYAWNEIQTVRPVDEEAEEPLYEVVTETSHLNTIRNPLLRFLHWQAYGRRKLPLFGGLEDREELLAELRARLAQETSPMSAAEASEEMEEIERQEERAATAESEMDNETAVGTPAAAADETESISSGEERGKKV